VQIDRADIESLLSDFIENELLRQSREIGANLLTAYSLPHSSFKQVFEKIVKQEAYQVGAESIREEKESQIKRETI